MVEITPLIDVVFLLLTFFVFALILTTRVAVSEIALPEAATGSEGASGPPPVVVALDSSGVVSVNGRAVGTAGDDGFQEEFAAALAADAAGAGERSGVVLAIDRSSASGALLALFDALSEAGVDNASFWREFEGGRGGAPGDEAGRQGEVSGGGAAGSAVPGGGA